MKRRKFLKSTAAITGGGLLAGYDSLAQSESASKPVLGPTPNILFIMVDELRYPTVFPAGISTPAQFLAKYMPNVYKLWKSGVKFGSHHTAANACTPSRGVLISGLYSPAELAHNNHPLHPLSSSAAHPAACPQSSLSDFRRTPPFGRLPNPLYRQMERLGAPSRSGRS